MKTCSIDACQDAVNSWGWCKKHYQRWKRSGDPEHRRPSPDERFWAKVYLPPCEDDCWTWTAARNPLGYGRFDSGFAHRWSYEQEIGPIPAGLTIDHLCRNTSCVSPAHLEPVTNRENILRGEGSSAKRARQTACIHGHPFDASNTYINPSGWRQCRACKRRRDSRDRAARRG